MRVPVEVLVARGGGRAGPGADRRRFSPLLRMRCWVRPAPAFTSQLWHGFNAPLLMIGDCAGAGVTSACWPPTSCIDRLWLAAGEAVDLRRARAGWSDGRSRAGAHDGANDSLHGHLHDHGRPRWDRRAGSAAPRLARECSSRSAQFPRSSACCCWSRRRLHCGLPPQAALGAHLHRHRRSRLGLCLIASRPRILRSRKLSVEVVTIILLLLALNLLPKGTPRESSAAAPARDLHRVRRGRRHRALVYAC